jgi:S-DNA-T family DNA segregation ATPase FtsK/SpoIIIE
MAKRQKSKKTKKSKKRNKNLKREKQTFKYPILTSRLKRWIGALLLFLSGAIISFSFFSKAGPAGELIFKGLNFLIGRTIFFIPLLLVLGGLVILKPPKKRIFAPIFLGLLVLIFGISGLLTLQDISQRNGGWLGYIISWPFFNYFGFSVTLIVFSVLILIGGLILWEFLPKKVSLRPSIQPSPKVAPPQKAISKKEPKEALREKPKFEIKSIEIPQKKKETRFKEEMGGPETQPSEFPKEIGGRYKFPPIELLDTTEEQPSSGDIDYNALVIKKTLQNFGIEVEMSEVNIGPTVTQYTLKPAEGVKLSKITSLSNDLALALASHPIRIEAPIPGRALVGIEVPNKVRAKVKIGNLIGSKDFRKLPPLSFALGKDVMGNPVYPDLGKMPHLLVAGSTGSGKTICLNSLILSLIYRNSPRILRLILIDPKRVEFPVYSALPHLLTPVIFNTQKVVNALNWLVGEMERRFEVLREAGARDIISYNKILKEKPKLKEEGFEIMSYIVLIIDELADLMAAKGREIEAGIVRLSQLARAVGIHLVVATQRPSVEVITGLIKANITARVAFQVASQVDSRTILDVAGAEKLLGRGDMLFLSSEFSRPKRIQGSFVSTAEIRKVVDFIRKENVAEEKGIEEIKESLARELDQDQDQEKTHFGSFEEDPLYEEARKIVIEYRKASASLLQRRLKIGYARAARILDMLEERGVVGPADGAKPREVYIKESQISSRFQRDKTQNNEEDSEWQKV